MKRLTLLTLLVFGIFGGSALAAMQHGQMGMDMMKDSSSHAGAAPHVMEYMHSMDGMHGPMMKGIEDTDPDTAFVRGMIPHHQGAVEMAKIQLKYGKDPELKKMAQDIIEAQDKEIKFMEEWLKKNGK